MNIYANQYVTNDSGIKERAERTRLGTDTNTSSSSSTYVQVWTYCNKLICTEIYY